MSETDERLKRHDVMLERLVAWTARQMEFNAELVQLNLVVDERLARLEGRVDRLEGLGERHDAVLERLEQLLERFLQGDNGRGVLSCDSPPPWALGSASPSLSRPLGSSSLPDGALSKCGARRPRCKRYVT